MQFRQSLAALAFVALASAQQVPRPAGKFAINITSGGQIPISQYSGKVVVLAFMFTTCLHCQHSSQILSGIQDQYGDRGLQILGAFFNDNAAQLIPEFVNQFKPDFPVGYTTRDEVDAYLQHTVLKPTYVPVLVFIDRNGQIREQHENDGFLSGDQATNIRNVVESLLKEPVTAKKTARAAHKKQS